MPDDRAPEPPPGAPGQRALSAMEIAVRRAREAAGTAPLADPAPPLDRPAAPEPPSGNGVPPDRWLIRSIALVAALVVAAAIALIVSESGSPPPPSPSATRSSTPHTPSTIARNGGTARSTSTTIAAASGGPPEISSLSPASGSAGQTIVVAGANFLSSSGQIVATFDGQVAPTSCPAQNTCDVTVPASTSPSAQVVITTAGGASNAVTFTYG